MLTLLLGSYPGNHRSSGWTPLPLSLRGGAGVCRSNFLRRVVTSRLPSRTLRGHKLLATLILFSRDFRPIEMSFVQKGRKRLSTSWERGVCSGESEGGRNKSPWQTSPHGQERAPAPPP